MLKKTAQQGRRLARTEGVPSWYVEDSCELRTPLAAFFSILLGCEASAIQRLDKLNQLFAGLFVDVGELNAHPGKQ